MEKRFYTAREIAAYLGQSEDAVRKWALRGYMPFAKFGKSLRFDIGRIESWARERERLC